MVKRTDTYQATGDVVARMDAAIANVCACGCGRALRPDGPSAWFAGPDCQHRWAQTNAADPGDVYRRPDAHERPILSVEGFGDRASRYGPYGRYQRWAREASTTSDRLRALRDEVLAEMERRTLADEGWVDVGWADHRLARPAGTGYTVHIEWHDDDVDVTSFGEAWPVRRIPQRRYTARLTDEHGVEVACFHGTDGDEQHPVRIYFAQVGTEAPRAV